MATGKLIYGHTRKTRRRLGAGAPYLRALPPYPGGKRRLLPAIFGLIDSVCPRASWLDLVFADPFLGGGAVALAAKAQGFGHIVANDIAERSTLVGRGLLVNHRVRLTPAAVLRLFTPAPEVHLAPPKLLARMPERQRALLTNAWRHLHGGTFAGVERDLIALLLLKWLFDYFPLGLPAATDAHRIVNGDFDPVTGARLAHYVRRGRRLLRPSTLLTMADQINLGIFPGTADVSQMGVFNFLPSARADIVYLDPPYGGTQSYEMALMLVDEFIGAGPPPLSRFSSRRPPLDELLETCSHIPVLVLSLGNSLLEEEGARALVARHRRVHRLLSLPYRHYGAVGLSSEERQEPRIRHPGDTEMTGRQIASTPDGTELVRIPLGDLVPHPLNPNVMPDELKAKLAANIGASGRYPPLIVRPVENGSFQILDGHQRADVLRELGETTAVCYVWPASDEEALVLIATLNRLEGQDVPGRRAALIAELRAHDTLAELARLLPEDEAQLEATLELLDFDVDGLLARLTEEADRAAAQGPQLFSFAVEPEDAPTVERAVDRAMSTLTGRNRRGRALVLLARRYLEEAP